jgi:hypothetical protein
VIWEDWVKCVMERLSYVCDMGGLGYVLLCDRRTGVCVLQTG